MTKKQMITLIGCWILTVALFGVGWEWYLRFNECNAMATKIDNLTERQDQWLFTYVYLSSFGLKAEKKNELKQIINMNEPSIKILIEFFAEDCKSKSNMIKLSGMISGFERYLMVKGFLFVKREDFTWIRKMEDSLEGLGESNP